jgi:N-acetylmuramoyl-L-alanine amidase
MLDQEILDALTGPQALACTMMGEAGGDGRDGSSVEERIAVACVVRNRARERNKYGDSIKAVCLRKWQFSCWNVGDPNRPRLMAMALRYATNQPQMHALLDESLYLAEGVASGIILDRVHGANHYLTEALYRAKPPRWATLTAPVARVGSHVFFKL